MSLSWEVPLALLLLALTAWGGLGLWFRGPARISWRTGLVTGWALAGVAASALLLSPTPAISIRLGAPGAFGLLCVAFAAWWHSIRPLQTRNWADDVSRLLDFEIDGDMVALYNVRNFSWRTRKDHVPRWETRRYDLAALRSVDLLVSHWMGPLIAHTLISFGFADGRHLVFSVEVRRTRGQEFSALGGFFKQSELILVAADERDIVRVRSNIRGEDVYLYRVALPVAEIQALFHAYLREAAALREQPAFYHTLFSNCTTLVFSMVRRIVPGLPRDYRLLLSGYLPNYLYDLGALDTSRPFAELKRQAHLNDRALAADREAGTDAHFSQAIRRGVPAPKATQSGTEAD